jgi:hypothetical protein
MPVSGQVGGVRRQGRNMFCACPAWEFAAVRYLVKLQILQDKVHCTIGNLSRRTPIRDLHIAFKIPYLYDFVTKLCREQATAILSHDDVYIRIIGQGEARDGKYKRLIPGGRCTIIHLPRRWLYEGVSKSFRTD